MNCHTFCLVMFWRGRVVNIITIKTRPAITINRQNHNGVKFTQTVPEDPINSIKDYKIACVLDEFSYKSFQYEANFIQLDPDHWEETMLRENPHFLFVESAWRGKDLKWRKKIGGLNINQDNTLRELTNWCRSHQIPTVFWNKEDPSNFNHFIEAAKYFDFVFTTDIHSIPRYRTILGHDQVFDLMFAAQPRLHNPVDRDKDKIGKVAFAGTWYNQKHANRRKDLQLLLTPALDYDLHIYDRMFENKHQNYLFPDIYQHCIKGFLKYDEMIAVYKKYSVFLNVNSVSESPTMFSRRVFELLACGTPVISSYSTGIAELFPNVVKLCHTESNTRKYLQELLNDEEGRDRLSLIGQREVFSRHTYKHRLAKVLDSIGFRPKKDLNPGVTIISICRSRKMLRQAIINYLSQNYAPKELIIILSEPVDEANFGSGEYTINAYENVFLLQVRPDTTLEDKFNQALVMANFPYISFFCAGDYYAPNYLLDLLNAFDYTDADAVGKSSYYSGMEDTLILNNEKTENRYIDWLWGSAMVVKKELFDSSNHQYRLGFEHQYISNGGFLTGCRLYAADRFNYICNPRSLSKADIEQVSL